MKGLTFIPVPLLCIAFCLGACSDESRESTFEPEEAPPTGDIIVQMSVSGSGDYTAVGCGVMLDGHYCSHLHSGDRVTLGEVEPGPHTVAVVQIPKGCAATDGTSKAVYVQRGQTSDVRFSLHCGDGIPSRKWQR